MDRRPRSFALVATVAAPLALGAGIYVAWRSPDLRLLSWLDAAGLGDAVARFRAAAAQLAPVVPEWVLYRLPDGLWAFAAASAVAHSRHDAPCARRACWIAAPPTLGAAWEMGQGLGWLPGTFDPGDLAAYALAAAAVWVLDRASFVRPARHGALDPNRSAVARERRPADSSAGRADSVRALAVVLAFSLLLTGTSKSAPSPPPTPLGGGGGPPVPPAPTSMSPLDLPAPWDSLGLPASALAVDAMRFVHENTSRPVVEAEYVASLSSMGWRVVSRAPSTAPEGALVLERSGRRLAVRLRADGTTVRVSVNLMDPQAPESSTPEDSPDASGPAPDAGVDAGDAGTQPKIKR